MHKKVLMVLVITLSVQLLLSVNIVTSVPPSYYPSAYNLLGSTAYVSGALSDLQSDDGVYMNFRGYSSAASAQALYAHQETTSIGGISYYLNKLTSADAAGTSLSASMAVTGRQLLGKFVYPLTGVSSIPASTWTIYYRAWYEGVALAVATNSPSTTSGAWTTPDGAYTDGGPYAYTTSATAPGSQQTYAGYGFNLSLTSSVTKVRVRLDAWTLGNEQLKLEVSEDGGATFLPTTATYSLTTAETTYWTDVTGWTTWTPAKINSDKIRIRVSALKVGGAAQVNLDWAPIEVTYGYLPVGHADIDVSIRQADGTIRTTLATNVANSGSLSDTATTLSGTHAWSAYTVVDQTDYLEIDYYVDVTAAQSGVTAYLRIDDKTLGTNDETRIYNVSLPSQYTVEVEFTGTSNTYTLIQILWLIDSAWTAGGVSVTLQLYNYTADAYPATGDGYIAYTSSATPNIDETKSQTITTNPANFRDTLGNWKVKIKGVKAATTPFDFNADFIKYETTTVVEHDVAVLGVTPFDTKVYEGNPFNVTVLVKNEGPSPETFDVYVYAYNVTYSLNYAVGTQSVSLAAGETRTLSFPWNTATVKLHTVYTIKANATIISGEIDTADNELIDGTVNVKLMGDVNDDGIVDVFDLIKVGIAFGSKPGDPRWNPDADLKNDGIIDVFDLIKVGINFGRKAP